MQRLNEKIFKGICALAAFLPLILLLCLVGDVFITGIERLNWQFLTSYASRRAENAGIFAAFIGSIYLIGLTTLIALPLGVSAAIYLEEYGKNNRLARIIEVNIANLAGVPSVVYGLLGLGLFVRTLGLGRSLLAGALTMALLVLPVIIMATREALRTVPQGLRESCYALGATKWQTVKQVILPMAMSGILTGAILAVARAIGETAPLIVVGALAYVTFLPDSLSASFTALPIQIFNWISRPQEEFAINAAAGIVILLMTMLLLNAVAIYLRGRLQKRVF